MHTTIGSRRRNLNHCRIRLALLIATGSAGTALIGSPTELLAVSTSWQNPPASNLWADPANWTSGVPGPDDDAFLTAAFAPIDLGGATRAVRRLNAVGVPLLNGRIDARLLQDAGAEFTALSSSGLLELRRVIGATLGDGAGGGDFEVFGSSLFTNSTIVLRGASTYTGMTELLGEGRLEGALTRTSRINIPYSRFTVSANAAIADQLTDTGAVRLERGSLVFAGSVARTEAFGPLELGPRESLVRMTGPGAGSFVASAQSIQWQPGAMLRLESDGNIRLIVRQPPIGPPAGAPTDRPILPYGHAMAQVGPSSFHPSFLTYDHGTDPTDPADDVGLRPLDPATEYTSNPSSGGNVRLTMDHSITSSANVRSLSLVSAALTLDGRLTIGGNGLSFFNTLPGDPTRITGSGTLSFPGDAVIVAHTTFSDRYEISVPIEAQTITKGGNGGLVLTHPNTIPGGLFIAEGNLRSRADGVLGSGTVGLGGQLYIENQSQAVEHLRVFSGVRRPGTSISDAGTLHVGEGLVFSISQSVTGEGALRQSGPGTVHVTGTGSDLRLNWMVGHPDATLRVDGTIGGAGSTDFQLNSVGLITGAGTIGGSVNVNAGRIAPGPGTARLTIDRLNMGVFATEQPTLEFELNGLVPGAEHDQLAIRSGVLLSSSRAGLSVLPGFDAQVGDTFTIIDNLSASAVLGHFVGLPEGSVFSAGSELFQITYLGGDGNDVVLTAVIPEPAGLGAVMLATAALARCRRVRR